MTPPGITTVDAAGQVVWRVGRFPDPWVWADRAYSGRNRWDDPDGATLDGIRFASRHGDTLTLWAVFERDTDTDPSRHITPCTSADINEDNPDLEKAFTIHRLHWTR